MSEILTQVLAIVGAITGVGSALYSRRANRISANSNVTSQKALAIELERRHIDLTPIIAVTWKSTSPAYATINVELLGPAGMDRLDSVEAFVRNDKERFQHNPHMGSYTQADVDRLVWGPYRFVFNAQGVETGKRTHPFELVAGTANAIAMEPTMAPPWSKDNTGWWEREYESAPVRLSFTCKRGEDQWTVLVDVERGPEGQAVTSRSDQRGQRAIGN